jgi:hypothetical protein
VHLGVVVDVEAHREEAGDGDVDEQADLVPAHGEGGLHVALQHAAGARVQRLRRGEDEVGGAGAMEDPGGAGRVAEERGEILGLGGEG